MKYCSKCGSSNMDEAVFCSACGTPLAQAPAAPPPKAPAPAPSPDAPAYFPPQQPQEPQAYAPAQPASQPAAPMQAAAPAYNAYAGPDIRPKNSSMLWLILNIAATVLCCPAALFSIIGLIFGILGNSAYNKGDYEDMTKKSKISMILFIVGAVLGLLGWILTIIIWIVAKDNGGF